MENNIKKAGRYYWLLVIAQVVLLFAVLNWAAGSHPSLKARTVAARSDIDGGLKVILDNFKDDNGRYPTTAEGLKILIDQPKDGSLKYWRGPYFDSPEVPKDPWGHEYVYRFPGFHNPNGYDLYSLGPNGVSRTGGKDPDDISNWDKPIWSEGNWTLFDIASVSLLLIPFLFVVRVVVGIVSPSFRAVARENRLADLIWFAIAILALVVSLTPKITG